MMTILVAERSGRERVARLGESPTSSHTGRCHSLRSWRNFQFAEEVGRQKGIAKGGQRNTEDGAQRRAASLEDTLDPRREAGMDSPTDHINADKWINLNIKNSKKKALKSLWAQGLSIVTANPSRFGLKGVNSPLL